MIIDVFSQPYELLVILYGGLLSGVVYESLRFCRRILPRQAGLLDGLFVLLGGFLFVYFLLFSTRGELRWYVFAGFFTGMWLAKAAFRWIFSEIYKKFHKNQYPDDRKSGILLG